MAIQNNTVLFKHIAPPHLRR